MRVKKEEKYKQKKKYVKTLIASKGITTEIHKKNEAIKNLFDLKTKANKNSFDPKRDNKIYFRTKMKK